MQKPVLAWMLSHEQQVMHLQSKMQGCFPSVRTRLDVLSTPCFALVLKLKFTIGQGDACST